MIFYTMVPHYEIPISIMLARVNHVLVHRADIRRAVANIVAVAVSREVVANHVIATGVEVEVDQEKTKNQLQLLIHTRMNVMLVSLVRFVRKKITSTF